MSVQSVCIIVLGVITVCSLLYIAKLTEEIKQIKNNKRSVRKIRKAIKKPLEDKAHDEEHKEERKDEKVISTEEISAFKYLIRDIRDSLSWRNVLLFIGIVELTFITFMLYHFYEQAMEINAIMNELFKHL